MIFGVVSVQPAPYPGSDAPIDELNQHFRFCDGRSWLKIEIPLDSCR